MKTDSLKEFAKLRQQLFEEKRQLETRLNEINGVLRSEAGASASSQVQEAPVRPAGRRGRKPRASNTMSMREAVLSALSNGPLARKDLVNAMEGIGYKFASKNPLNSVGSVLYAKNSPVKHKGGKYFVAGGIQRSIFSSSNGVGAHGQTSVRRKQKRKVSPEAKARMSAAQRARRAKEQAGR